MGKLIGITKWVAGVLGALILAAAATSPDVALPNIAAWARKIGLTGFSDALASVPHVNAWAWCIGVALLVLAVVVRKRKGAGLPIGFRDDHQGDEVAAFDLEPHLAPFRVEALNELVKLGTLFCNPKGATKWRARTERLREILKILDAERYAMDLFMGFREADMAIWQIHNKAEGVPKAEPDPAEIWLHSMRDLYSAALQDWLRGRLPGFDLAAALRQVDVDEMPPLIRQRIRLTTGDPQDGQT